MGPWAEPALRVECPEAVASDPPLPVGLEVTLGALVLLLVLTLICSPAPVCVPRRPGANPDASAFQKALTTCLLDLLPDPLSATEEALAALNVMLRFPLQGFILAMASSWSW